MYHIFLCGKFWKLHPLKICTCTACPVITVLDADEPDVCIVINHCRVLMRQHYWMILMKRKKSLS